MGWGVERTAGLDVVGGQRSSETATVTAALAAHERDTMGRHRVLALVHRFSVPDETIVRRRRLRRTRETHRSL